jgi:hypothetical protein
MSCCCGDEIHSEFYCERRPTARKNHKCCECGSEIIPGEKYESVTMKWCGVICRFKTCNNCLKIKDLMKSLECFCWHQGGLFDAVREHFIWEENAPPGLRMQIGRLIVESRREKSFRKNLHSS